MASKEEVRERIWELLELERAARFPGARGRIPNFRGAEVHEVQLLDEELPETEHDSRVDVIVTPISVLRTRRHRRPPGILWDHLDAEKRAAIPVLASD